MRPNPIVAGSAVAIIVSPFCTVSRVQEHNRGGSISLRFGGGGGGGGVGVGVGVGGGRAVFFPFYIAALVSVGGCCSPAPPSTSITITITITVIVIVIVIVIVSIAVVITSAIGVPSPL